MIGEKIVACLIINKNNFVCIHFFFFLLKFWFKLIDSMRAGSLEGRLEARKGRTKNTVGKREFDLAVVELLCGSTTGILGSDFLYIHDLNASKTSTVASSHVVV